jgi:HK97 family phage prohead protease
VTLRFDHPDGRVLEACIVPFEETVVDDGAGAFRERFTTGAFREQIEAQSPLRVWLDVSHQKNTVIGHAVGLRELGAGLYGSFAVHTGVVGDKVLQAVREGLVGVSMTVTPIRSREVDGVTHRRKAHLMAVSLVAKPAYRTATVFGIRRALGGEQAEPASSAEFVLWQLERQDGKLRALQMQYMDDALEQRRSYTADPRYLEATRLRREIADKRAELEAAAPPKTAVEASRRQLVLRRACGEVLAVR